MSYLFTVVVEAMIALKERDASCSLLSVAEHLQLLRNRKDSSKALFSAACRHLLKAIKEGLANGSLVKALGGGGRGGHGLGRGFDPIGRLLQVLLASARASCKFKSTAKKSTTQTRKGTIAAPRRKKPAAYAALSGLMEVVKILSGRGTAVRSRATNPKSSPTRKRKPPTSSSSSSRTAAGATPAAKKKSAMAAKRKRTKELAATNRSKGVVRKKTDKAVTAAARKKVATKKGAGAAPKARRKRTAARKK